MERLVNLGKDNQNRDTIAQIEWHWKPLVSYNEIVKAASNDDQQIEVKAEIKIIRFLNPWYNKGAFYLLTDQVKKLHKEIESIQGCETKKQATEFVKIPDR